MKPPAPAGDSEQGAAVKSTTEIEVTQEKDVEGGFPIGREGVLKKV